MNLADHTTTKEIEEAIYVMTAHQRKGCRCVLVERPFFGNWSETVNTQVIMERMFERLCPEIYRRLRALAVDMECSSILELINLLIDAHTIEQLNAEYRQPFEDARRHDFGRPIEYGQRTKRKHRKTVSSLFDQMDFSDRAKDINDALTDNNSTADTSKAKTGEQVEDEMGFKQIGGEW